MSGAKYEEDTSMLSKDMANSTFKKLCESVSKFELNFHISGLGLDLVMYVLMLFVKYE